MVLDTSAIVAILREEPEGPDFVHLLATAEDPLISAATLLAATTRPPDGLRDAKLSQAWKGGSRGSCGRIGPA